MTSTTAMSRPSTRSSMRLSNSLTSTLGKISKATSATALKPSKPKPQPALTKTHAPLTAPDHSQTLPPPAAADTDHNTLLSSAIAHLFHVRPALAPIIAAHPCTPFGPAALAEVVEPFQALCSSIISQQVSGAAARSIKAKFVALFEADLTRLGLTFPTPELVFALTPEQLRPAGLSGRKADYVRALAEAFLNNHLTLDLFRTGTDEEIVKKLTAVHGLGVWSAEMFLLFALKRTDVFSVGDLGIQRGFAALLGRDVEKLKRSGKGKWKYMGEKEMLEEAEPYRPYRSVLCWYLWRVGDVGVDAFGAAGKEEEKPKPKAGTKRKVKVEEEAAGEEKVAKAGTKRKAKVEEEDGDKVVKVGRKRKVKVEEEEAGGEKVAKAGTKRKVKVEEAEEEAVGGEKVVKVAKRGRKASSKTQVSEDA